MIIEETNTYYLNLSLLFKWLATKGNKFNLKAT